MFTGTINARVKSRDNQFRMTVNTVPGFDPRKRTIVLYPRRRTITDSCQSFSHLVLALHTAETAVAALNAYLYIESKTTHGALFLTLIHIEYNILNFTTLLLQPLVYYIPIDICDCALGNYRSLDLLFKRS